MKTATETKKTLQENIEKSGFVEKALSEVSDLVTAATEKLESKIVWNNHAYTVPVIKLVIKELETLGYKVYQPYTYDEYYDILIEWEK